MKFRSHLAGKSNRELAEFSKQNTKIANSSSSKSLRYANSVNNLFFGYKVHKPRKNQHKVLFLQELLVILSMFFF